MITRCATVGVRKRERKISGKQATLSKIAGRGTVSDLCFVDPSFGHQVRARDHFFLKLPQSSVPSV